MVIATGIFLLVVMTFLIHNRHREDLYTCAITENRKPGWWQAIVTTIGAVALLVPGLWAWDSAVAAPDIAAGKARYIICAACHGMQGEGNIFVNAPKLAGQKGWYLKRQVKNYRQGVRGSDAADTFGQQMAPMAVMMADDAEINNIVAYITSLPMVDSPPTISGDADRGKDLFNTCKSCHGPQGLGIQALNAPRLSGIDDWYLVRQLENYKRGIRGSNPQDLYGRQMAQIAEMLRDDQDIRDVVAYINTL